MPSPIIVNNQLIDPRISAFREKWLSSDLSKEQLKKKKDRSSTEYGSLDPSRLRKLDNKTSLVNLTGLNWRWEDADTIILKKRGLSLFQKPIAIRLTGIDSPEIGTHGNTKDKWFRFNQDQPHGKRSTRLAESIAPSGSDINLVIASDPKQRTYNRYIGLIYKPGEEEPLNLKFAREGIAAALPFGESGSDIYPRKAFISAEREAIKEKRGMWSDPYFQAYLDVSEGVGARITLNTFTDLSRLSKNYNLASAESYMRTAEENGDRREGERIGMKLAPFYNFTKSRGGISHEVRRNPKTVGLTNEVLNKNKINHTIINARDKTKHLFNV